MILAGQQRHLAVQGAGVVNGPNPGLPPDPPLILIPAEFEEWRLAGQKVSVVKSPNPGLPPEPPLVYIPARGNSEK